jgi:drug/metabolite transporter (DMT)-like permease
VSDGPDRPTADGEATDATTLSTREYLRLTVFNPVSLAGAALAATGVTYTLVTSPSGPFGEGDPLVGAGLLLGGALVFALGFSWGQRRLGDRADW